jgi:hypothetical protein
MRGRTGAERKKRKIANQPVLGSLAPIHLITILTLEAFILAVVYLATTWLRVFVAVAGMVMMVSMVAIFYRSKWWSEAKVLGNFFRMGNGQPHHSRDRDDDQGSEDDGPEQSI